MSRVVAAYTAAMARQPLATNGVLGFAIAGLGDVGCQLLVEKEEHVNWRRTLDMGTVRAVFLAPLLYLYFPMLAKVVPSAAAAATRLDKVKQVAKRVAVDQLVGSPVSISLTFAANALIKGQPSDTVPRIQHHLLPTWAQGAQYWPFVHGLNFFFVPPAHQAIVAHVASVYWNGVLSYRSNSRLPHHVDGAANGVAAAPAAATADSVTPVA